MNTSHAKRYSMIEVSYIAAEFPDRFLAIQRLCLKHSTFAEICDDLELMGRDLASFPKAERLGEQGAYSDIQESLQALREELVEYLHCKVRPTVDRM